MKKSIIYLLICILGLTSIIIPNVQAENFANNEAKYLSLCSSNRINQSNKNTCRKFNTYLKTKNANLKKSIKETNKSIASTKANIESIAKQISQTTDDLAKKEQEINYLTQSIKLIETDINKKEKDVKERMYLQQADINNSNLTNYIFGANNFIDFFQRLSTISEITKYDKDIINQLLNQKNEIKNQQETLKVAKENLELQKSQQASLQTQYNQEFEKQNAQLVAKEKLAQQTRQQQSELDDALAALINQAASQTTSISGLTGNSALGKAIASKALSKQGSAYRWGAAHDMGQIANPSQSSFDCSGLVAWAHYQAGVNIGSVTSGSLARMGRSITASQLQAGDVVCFRGHVGIAINSSQMVHAPQPGDVVKVINLTPNLRARITSYRRIY